MRLNVRMKLLATSLVLLVAALVISAVAFVSLAAVGRLLAGAKPLDREAIARAAAETGAIVVAEEHLVDCGLGVRVAQVVAETNPCPMEFVGVTGYAESGPPEALLDKYGLRAPDVAAAARKVLGRKKS